MHMMVISITRHLTRVIFILLVGMVMKLSMETYIHSNIRKIFSDIFVILKITMPGKLLTL